MRFVLVAAVGLLVGGCSSSDPTGMPSTPRFRPDPDAGDAMAPRNDAQPTPREMEPDDAATDVCRLQCGAACCGDDEECELGRCVPVCESGVRCDGETASTCCDEGEVCFAGGCIAPGAVCTRSGECGSDEYCDVAAGHCLPRVAGGGECEYRPPVGPFELALEWSWEGDADVLPLHAQVMMTPMVANLDDDDGDGDVDAQDVPDVVFHAFAGSNYHNDGVLRAVSGRDGSRIFPTTDPGYRSMPGSEVAIAELIESSLGPEIAFCRDVEHVGKLAIASARGEVLVTFDSVSCSQSAPAIADMDGDGVPEIVVGYAIARPDGTIALAAPRVVTNYTTLANVDDDPDLEVLGADGALDLDGTFVWDRGVAGAEPALTNGGFVAVADLDLDGDPELVIVAPGEHTIRALDARTGATVWGPFDVNPPEVAEDVMNDGTRGGTGGGPPTIANFDDDPEPEIAFAGGFAYVVFEHDGTRAWFAITTDRSSRATGSSIFDFEGDGHAEVVYNDERALRVYRGESGTIIQEGCNTSGTLIEYPVVVDVDNDDQAEIVVAANNYAYNCLDGSPSATGIRVYGHPRREWVRTRRIWNQHTYHVTNVDEDGRVPRREASNWSVAGLNNFRQNVRTDGVFDAPDLVLEDLGVETRMCPTGMHLRARVVNRGRAGAPAGIEVAILEEGSVIGTLRTTRALLPGESELLGLDIVDDGSGLRTFTARIEANDALHQCREENDVSAEFAGRCPELL